MKDMAGAIAMLKTYEGCFPFMYLDSRGYVTVGVGFLLESPDHACGYQFYLNGGTDKATADHIRAEWNHLKCQSPNHLETYYKQFTTMQMIQVDIDAVLADKVNTFEKQARQTFPKWDDFPSLAQLALIDMIFNLGSLVGFPTLTKYALKQDWKSCAAQCYRRGPGDQRNNETRDRFLAAAKEQPPPPFQATA